MAVAGLFTALEDRFGFVLEEDEIDGDLLETYGALPPSSRASWAHAGPCLTPCPRPLALSGAATEGNGP
jgi:hypothetical protein